MLGATEQLVVSAGQCGRGYVYEGGMRDVGRVGMLGVNNEVRGDYV